MFAIFGLVFKCNRGCMHACCMGSLLIEVLCNVELQYKMTIIV